MRTILTLGLMLALLTPCQAAESKRSSQPPDVVQSLVFSFQQEAIDKADKLSLQLASNLSEQEVVRRAVNPTRVELDTCGTDTREPWNCKVYTYDFGLAGLSVFFQEEEDNDWRVNGWWVDK